MFVNERHGMNAILALPEFLPGWLVLDAARLQAEETGYDLKIILDAVVNLLEQNFLLAQRRADLSFGPPPFGDVAKNHRIDHLPFQLHLRDASLGGKLGPVAAASGNLIAFGHPPGRSRDTSEVVQLLFVR